MTARLRCLVVACVAVAVLGAGCSNGDDAQTTVDPGDSSSTTSLAPTIEGPLSTTTPTTAPTTTSTTIDPVSECSRKPTGRHLVDVRPDDPDGGLNLRGDPGADNPVIVPLPAGTEVVADGPCVELAGSGEWWAVSVATDASIGGWVAASFLEPLVPAECPADPISLEGLRDLSFTVADMDGDGQDDRVYIGNDDDSETARMVVELATGGFVEAALSVSVAGEVAEVFRPIGAHREVLMYRDVFGGGASTSRFVFAEVDGCSVRDFDSVLAGASAGWGSLGYCLEDTPLGVRFWRFDATGESAEEGEANRVDEAFHYYEGEFVPVAADPADPADRECLESSRARTFGVAPAFDDTRAVGFRADTLEALIEAVAAAIGGDEDSTLTAVGEPTGIDAQGGFATYDLVGVKDDSIGGFRIRLDFGTVLDDGSIVGVRADRVELLAFCTRGVTDTGFCI